MNNLSVFLFAIAAIFEISCTEKSIFSRNNAQKYVFDLAGSRPAISGLGGNIRFAGKNNFPILDGQGVGFAILNIEPCGIVTPHIHPRASNILYAIDVENFQVGLIEEGGDAAINILKNGMITLFPKGVIHFTQNLGCKNAILAAAYNSEDGGLTTISEDSFKIPNDILGNTLRLNETTIESIRRSLPKNVARGTEACLKRCKPK